MGIAGALIVVILAGAALNEYVFKPRTVLASVNGTEIRRRDYWKYRAVDLADQANQYIAIANSPFVDENQRQQYLTLAQQASAQIDEVWGSTELDEATLQRMIDDQLYLQNLDEFGITITDQDIQDYIDQRFQPAEAPIFTPTPSPTLIPERAAWATETAVAIEATEDVPTATIEAVASPVATPAGLASPVVRDVVLVPATPELVASPEVVVPAATPVAGSPAASPVGMDDPTPSPTPNQAEARQTAAANYEEYRDAIFDRAHLSRSDYIELIVLPAIARERIEEQLTADIGQRAEQVRAAHILVDTRDLADAIYNDLMAGADFEQIARDQSIDSGTAPNGGDLGWFTRGQMVDEFEEVAFSTPPGQISAPFETEFGWHIVKVYEHADERALTDDQITQLRSAIVEDWLEAQRAEADIDSEIAPTPTSAGPESFVPPPDAPPLPTPTPEMTLVPASPVAEQSTPLADVPLPTPETVAPVDVELVPASPIASPIVVPTAASPVAAPSIASPTAASQGASPVAASPVASPAP